MEPVHHEKDKVRLQVELIPSQVAALSRLMTVCGFQTRKELINNALTLFEWAVTEVSRGNQIASLDKDQKRYEVLRMPALTAAEHHARDLRLTKAQPVTGAPGRLSVMDSRAVEGLPIAPATID